MSKNRLSQFLPTLGTFPDSHFVDLCGRIDDCIHEFYEAIGEGNVTPSNNAQAMVLEVLDTVIASHMACAAHHAGWSDEICQKIMSEIVTKSGKLARDIAVEVVNGGPDV